MSINQLKIGQRLSLAFASVLALLVALSALAWFSLEASQQAMKDVEQMERRATVANHLPPDKEILLHSENGLVGMGPALKMVGQTSIRTVTDFNFAVVPMFLAALLLSKGWRTRLFALGAFGLACLAWLVPMVIGIIVVAIAVLLTMTMLPAMLSSSVVVSVVMIVVGAA